MYILLDYYKKNCSTYEFVFKDMKVLYFCLISSPYVLVILTIGTAILFKKEYIVVFCILLYLILLAGLFYIVNLKAKKIVSDNYLNEKPVGYMWNSTKVLNILNDLRKKRIIEFIKKNNIVINEIELKKLNQQLIRESERTKIQSIIIPTVFGTLFVSLWNNFFSNLFKNTNDSYVALKLFAFGCVSLVYMMIFFNVYKLVRRIILEDIIYSDNKKMLSLAKLLDEVNYDVQRFKKFT